MSRRALARGEYEGCWRRLTGQAGYLMAAVSPWVKAIREARESRGPLGSDPKRTDLVRPIGWQAAGKAMNTGYVLVSVAIGIAMAWFAAPTRAQDAALQDSAVHEQRRRARIPTQTLLYHIQNPFAFIPRLPIENQFDFGSGDTGGMTYEFSVRPVIPFDLSDEYALVTRTSLRLNYDQALEPEGAAQVGFGDIDQEFYFTTDHAVDRKWVFGAGPVIRWPTATRSEFGGQLWGLGPAAGLIFQPAGVDATSGWTFMLLTHHLFDIAGRSNKGSLSFTYVMPEVSYTTEGGTNLYLDMEPVYDWISDKWVVPVNFNISQLMQPNGQPLVLTIGGQYFAHRLAGGPEWGGQISVNFLFPE